MPEMIMSKIEVVKMVRSVTDLGLPDCKLIADTYFRIRGMEKNANAMVIDVLGILEISRFVGAINSGKISIENGRFIFGKPTPVSDNAIASICSNTFQWYSPTRS